MERIRISTDKFRKLVTKISTIERSQSETKLLCFVALIVSLASLVLHAI